MAAPRSCLNGDAARKKLQRAAAAQHQATAGSEPHAVAHHPRPDHAPTGIACKVRPPGSPLQNQPRWRRGAPAPGGWRGRRASSGAALFAAGLLRARRDEEGAGCCGSCRHAAGASSLKEETGEPAAAAWWDTQT